MEEYTIYKCIGSCTWEKPVYKNDSKECIENCGNLYELNGVCYSSCDQNNYFSTYDSTNNKYICSNQCDSQYPFPEETKKICEKECSFISSRIAIIKTDPDKKYCVNKCEEEDNGYNYLQIKEEDNKLYCLKKCPQKYDNEKKICMQKYQKPKNYVKDNECLTECPSPDDKFTEIDGEYICSTSCETDPFFYTYKDSNLCLQNCYSGDYLEEEGKICINDCTLLSSTEKKLLFL